LNVADPGLFPQVSGVPENYLTAANTQLNSYTQGIGVAIPPNMAAPAGAQLARPELPGFPLPGARPVEYRPAPVERGVKDGRVAGWSAPVLSIDDDLAARVARQTPGGSGTPSRPTPPVPGPFGSARIPSGGGRGGGRP
jgi:hypothetical protein